jgi:hypothetical protein
MVQIERFQACDSVASAHKQANQQGERAAVNAGRKNSVCMKKIIDK